MKDERRSNDSSVCMLLLVAATLGFFGLTQPAFGQSAQLNHRRELSYGYLDAETNTYYFLVDYRISRSRRPVWFILPIERPPQVYFHKIYLYSYDATHARLQQLAVLRDDVGPNTNVKYSRFTRTATGIVIAYSSGWAAGEGLQHDVFILDPHSAVVRPAGGQSQIPETSTLFQQYFGTYLSPFEANPGVVGITELRTRVLATVSEDDWGLPRQVN